MIHLFLKYLITSSQFLKMSRRILYPCDECDEVHTPKEALEIKHGIFSNIFKTLHSLSSFKKKTLLIFRMLII